jgi:hypothetical protein
MPEECGAKRIQIHPCLYTGVLNPRTRIHVGVA